MKNVMNCAEAIDFLNKRVAIGMFIVSITYFMQATEKLLEPGFWNSALDIASGIGVILTMLVTISGMYPVARLKIGGMFLKAEPESFLTDAMNTSFKNSWIITMLITVVALAFAKFIDEWDIETSFYLILFFGIMTFTASVNFFVIVRNDEKYMEE